MLTKMTIMTNPKNMNTSKKKSSSSSKKSAIKPIDIKIEPMPMIAMFLIFLVTALIMQNIPVKNSIITKPENRNIKSQ